MTSLVDNGDAHQDDNDMSFSGEMHMRSEYIATHDMISSLLEDGQDGPSGTATTANETTELLQKNILNMTLEEVDRIAMKRIHGGFNQVNFTCGVLNSILVVYTFGVYPQHFWILYLVEGILLVSTKIYIFATAKPLNNIYYLLDFCWIMNVLAILALLLFCCDGILFGRQLSERLFYLASAGMACGPLLGACLVLPFVCLLFHDVGTMADLFIHIFPPMVMYTLRWCPNALRNAWPTVFYLDYLERISFFPISDANSISGIALGLYLLWWFMYSVWMCIWGLKLPSNGVYDTVFHSLMRGGLCQVFGETFWRRPSAESQLQMETNRFGVRDFLVYMLLHAVLAIMSILVLGFLCFRFKSVHGLCLVLVTVVATHRGAQRYTYYTTVMYGRVLRKRFELDERTV